MFRFTDWFEKGHDFGSWETHFAVRTVRVEIRSCAHGMTALFREGAEAIDHDALTPRESSLLAYEEKYGCECGWAQDWENRRGRRPGTRGETSTLA